MKTQNKRKQKKTVKIKTNKGRERERVLGREHYRACIVFLAKIFAKNGAKVAFGLREQFIQRKGLVCNLGPA